MSNIPANDFDWDVVPIAILIVVIGLGALVWIIY